MIIDDIYINQDQITKISYNYSYSESPEMEVFEISKFKLVCINDEEIQIFLMKDKIFKRDKVISYNYNKEDYLLEKGKLKKAKKRPKNLKNAYGFIKVFIELSSGTRHETIICKFEDKVDIDRTALYGGYKESKFGVKFNPKEVNIEFICDIIFQNKKQFKKEKVMI